MPVELARQADDADAVIVFSGDGGFNEVLNGVEREDLPLGFVPGGGTSVLPRTLGLPREPEAAAAQLAESLAFDGRGGSRRDASTAGGSPSAQASAWTRRPCGGSTSVAAPPTAGGPAISRSSRRSRACWSSGVGNSIRSSRSTATDARRSSSSRTSIPYSFLKALAIQVAPEAAFEQGLDFLAPRSLTPRTLPPLLFSLATGRPVRNAYRGHDLDRIEVRCDEPMPLHADGEDLGDVREAVFEAERRAVTVLG
jgi:hypothetical protein